MANCQTHNYHLPIVSWSNPVGYGSEFPRIFWFQMRNTTSLLASHHLENSALVHNQSMHVYLTKCLHICLYIYIVYTFIYIYIDITGVSHFEKTPLVHRFNPKPFARLRRPLQGGEASPGGPCPAEASSEPGRRRRLPSVSTAARWRRPDLGRQKSRKTTGFGLGVHLVKWDLAKKT